MHRSRPRRRCDQEPYLFSIFRKSLPGLKRTLWPLGISTLAQVLMFRPAPCLRGRGSKTPNPRISMGWPSRKAFFMRLVSRWAIRDLPSGQNRP